MIPYIISATISLVIMATLSFIIPDPSQAHSTLIVGVIAFFTIMAMPIYNIDKWSLRKKTIVHILAMLVTVLPCTAMSGWFDISRGSGILAMLAMYVAFGVAGWTVGFLANKFSTKQK